MEMADTAVVVERTHYLLRQFLGDLVEPPNERRAWTFNYGSVTILVAVVEREDNEPAVLVACPVVEDVEESFELLDVLNTMNYSMHFGVAYWRDDTVWVAANLLGETLDLPELQKALTVVGEWSDNVDEAMAQRFGSSPATGFPRPPRGVVGGT
jgi:T3SS (YopN, CesT) and YbjN peptide-binding chaperone 1